MYSAGLIGVVGSTGASEPAFYHVSIPNVSLTCRFSHAYPRDWKTSTCFSSSGIHLLAECTSFYSRVCLILILQIELLSACFRIILFKLPLVLPTRTSWLVMLLLIGIFGFVSQVCHLILVLPQSNPVTLKPTKILLTTGFQRETVGRATLAMYSSVRLRFSHYRKRLYDLDDR